MTPSKRAVVDHIPVDADLGRVLTDGTNTYLYGLGRVAQVNTSAEYFLDDALGSVRQMTDASGDVIFTQSYDPYGVALGTSHTALGTSFDFTAEQTDPTGMVYLHTRYYAPEMGRFMSRDTWGGDDSNPLSLNRWNYTRANPINYIDPSGYITQGPEALEAVQIVQRLKTDQIYIVQDWGCLPMPINPTIPSHFQWETGLWTINDLRDVEKAVGIMKVGIHQLGGNFNALIILAKIVKFDIPDVIDPPHTIRDTVYLPNETASPEDWETTKTVIHELGHVLTHFKPQSLTYFMHRIGSTHLPGRCPEDEAPLGQPKIKTFTTKPTK